MKVAFKQDSGEGHLGCQQLAHGTYYHLSGQTFAGTLQGVDLSSHRLKAPGGDAKEAALSKITNGHNGGGTREAVANEECGG